MGQCRETGITDQAEAQAVVSQLPCWGWLRFGVVPGGLGAQQPLKASHESLPEDAQTDELGIWVPIPVSHPARRFPASDDFPTGPEVGETVPSFSLTDHNGLTVQFPKSDEGKKTILLFQRSAVW